MVLGYMCETYGYVRECDVSESGERICRECGMAVTGITGNIRGPYSPPTDKPHHQSGNIKWHVSGWDLKLIVDAFDHEDALEKAIKKVDNPQNINEVKPVNRQYRRY